MGYKQCGWWPEEIAQKISKGAGKVPNGPNAHSAANLIHLQSCVVGRFEAVGLFRKAL